MSELKRYACPADSYVEEYDANDRDHQRGEQYYRCDEADALLASQREEIARLRDQIALMAEANANNATASLAKIATLTATNERLAKDAGRLDWLEAMGNAKGGLLLHSEVGSTGRTGLGLGCTGRTLRQAIDDAAQPAQPAQPDEKGA